MPSAELLTGSAAAAKPPSALASVKDPARLVEGCTGAAGLWSVDYGARGNGALGDAEIDGGAHTLIDGGYGG